MVALSATITGKYLSDMYHALTLTLPARRRSLVVQSSLDVHQAAGVADDQRRRGRGFQVVNLALEHLC